MEAESPQRADALNSIHLRLMIASLVVLPIFCGVLAWSLDRAFYASLMENAEEKLQLQIYALIAAAEFDAQTLNFPEHFSEKRLNQPSSDLFAVAHGQNSEAAIWRSPSALGVEGVNDWQPMASQPGQFVFTVRPINGQDYLAVQYAFAWETESTLEAFVLSVFESMSGLRAQHDAYRQSLWIWILAIAVSIIMLQLWILRWGLRPIDAVVSDLQKMHTGQQGRLAGKYPKELQMLTSSINQLVAQEQDQKKRYRNTLSDLAHSIKTPLAVLQGEAGQSSCDRKIIQEQSRRIDEIVSYQLNRSALAGKGVFSEKYSVQKCLDELVPAIKKVYSERKAEISVQIEHGAVFRGDKGDFMEIVGNLLDNAYKYGAERISVTANKRDSEQLHLVIEDDGPGIDSAELKTVIERGARADTSVSGQGLGLAIVRDIVSSYDGSLQLGQSRWGGLKVDVSL